MRTAFLPPLQIYKPSLFCLHHSPSLPTHTHFKMCISEHINRLRTLRPNLGPTSHKGQSGRIAIIGGSELYTGAPFFAAQSALYAGADLSYVYTTSSAAPPIKSYSPDLIVHPGFHHLGEGLEALERMHAVVVGPGLGREEYAGELLGRVLGWGGNVVIDADALWFLRDEGWRGALGITGVRVLTPNKIEALRLLKAADCDTMESFTTQYSNVVVVEKGPVDRIICQGRVVEVSVQAAKKRAGGQGDVLAGVIAAFCAWCDTREDVFSAAVCASMVARTAGRKAYAQVGRALVSSDLLRFVGSAVEEVLGADDG